MPGSRLPDEGSGAMPRKVAELLRSDESVEASLSRVSSLVRARGLGPRVLERILLSSPTVCSDTLRLLEHGACGEEGRRWNTVTDAVNGPDPASAWRAGVMASWADFVTVSVRKTSLKPPLVFGTGWAVAETAFWVAGKHILDPDEAFVSALCLDAGLVALMYALPDVYAAYAGAKEKKPVEHFEREAFGFNHESVGCAVLRAFKFSEDTALEANFHHAPHHTLGMTGKVLRAALTAVGEAGGDFGIGSPVDPLDRQVMEGALLRPEHETTLRLTAQTSLSRAVGFQSAAPIRAA
jgi:hypothetical protein